MKYINLLFVAFFTFVFTSVSAQNSHTRSADQAYDHESFFDAIDLYKKAYPKLKNNADKAEVLYKIAECYREMEEEAQAEVWFNKAIQAKYPDPICILHLADALRCQENYEAAEENYKKYQTLKPGDEHAANGISSCEEAKKWKAAPTKHIIDNEVLLNSPQYDYAPSFASHDYSKLIFTSTRPGSTGDDLAGRTGQNYDDLYSTQRDEKGKWSTPVPMPTTINTHQSEGYSALTGDLKTLYFTRCKQEKGEYLGCHIYKSTYDGSTWSESVELEISDSDTIVVAHPSVSEDGSHLFFASDMPGGKGGKDLWFVKFDEATGKYGAPTNISGVNSAKNEMFPYYREDGELFFASDGHVGMGGYDIYKSQKTGEDQWGEVENMKYPINSPMNDFGLVMENEEERGYFTSNRMGGKGHDDIYSYYIAPLIFVLEGTIKDVDSGEPVQGVTIKLVGSDGSLVEVDTDEKGYYKFAEIEGKDDRYIHPNATYTLEPSKVGFLVKKGDFTTVGFTESTVFEQNFELQNYGTNGTGGIDIEFPEVLYDLAKWTLRPESKDSLNFLYQTLVDNPTIVIELSAHTDSRGGEDYNKDLSQKRAQSCVDYLIEKGIHSERLTPLGYGESLPIFSDGDIAKLQTKEEQEAAHQKNRRTVFKVLRDNFVPKANEE
jgi:peptidoglycan-associated lipoprotein